MTKSGFFPCIRVSQPLGDFYVTVIPSDVVATMSYADRRELESENNVFNYLGVQRELSKSRIKEIVRFVNSPDAAFPTSIVLSVKGECVVFSKDMTSMEFREAMDVETETLITFEKIGRILDGQHRIEALREFTGKAFELPVTVLIDADISDEAYIFATVNLAQTKVNKSLVYDLLALASTRSPHKSAHDVVVALDQVKDSPFYLRIKRLGKKTEGKREFVSQATVVDMLVKHISEDPVADRHKIKNGEKLPPVDEAGLKRCVFRNFFVREEDGKIARTVRNFFRSAASKWPKSWESDESGNILPRTNGVRALLRFIGPCIVFLDKLDEVIDQAAFDSVFARSKLKEVDFNIEKFPPGTSGETRLFNELKSLIV